MYVCVSLFHSILHCLPQNGVTAVDVARVHRKKELCELLSKSPPPSQHTDKEEATSSATTPTLASEPQQMTDIATPPAPDEKPWTTPPHTTVPQQMDEKSTPPPPDKPQDTPDQRRRALEVRLSPLTHCPAHAQHVM